MIVIYGASDDLVEVDGAVGASPEEYYVYGGTGKLVWRADFIEPDPADAVNAGRLRVYGIYDGCWHFSVGQVDQDYKLPKWPIRIQQGDQDYGEGKAGSAYSAVLLIGAPEGTRIRNLWPAPDADQ